MEAVVVAAAETAAAAAVVVVVAFEVGVEGLSTAATDVGARVVEAETLPRRRPSHRVTGEIGARGVLT